MSANWITLIPENPNYVPAEEKRLSARDRLLEFAPDADQIDINVFDEIQFFDCGANFQRVRCPSCASELPISWWLDRMDADYEDGFKLAAYVMPCCGASQTLHELVCEWPQGFGRFSLDAMNPNIGILEDEHKRELEEVLGTKLRVIYQHL